MIPVINKKDQNPSTEVEIKSRVLETESSESCCLM